MVAANQRWRLLGACAEVLRERGYAGTTVTSVTKVAVVSRATFYRNFESVPGCILATYELAAGNVLAVLEEACEGEEGVGSSTTEVLSVVLSFLETESALAHVLSDAALNDVPGLPPARGKFTARCAALLASSRGARRSGAGDRRARHLVRGLQGWLSMRLTLGRAVGHPDDLARILTL